jgi:TetR/AcrR family transcriptional repressor of lmrAB and yxaGH operons
MSAPTNARTRMIQSAAVLFRERGVEATALSDVIEHSGAPRGSIYHHFPGGKAELTEAATAYAGDFIAQAIVAATDQGDPMIAIRKFVDFWRTSLRESDIRAGCPVVAAAVEGDRTPGARIAAGAAFERWQALLAASLEGRGVAPQRAASLAALVIASIEGAIVLARAQHDVAPLDRVSVELEALVAGALAEAA